MGRQHWGEDRELAEMSGVSDLLMGQHSIPGLFKSF